MRDLVNQINKPASEATFFFFFLAGGLIKQLNNKRKTNISAFMSRSGAELPPLGLMLSNFHDQCTPRHYGRSSSHSNFTRIPIQNIFAIPFCNFLKGCWVPVILVEGAKGTNIWVELTLANFVVRMKSISSTYKKEDL